MWDVSCSVIEAATLRNPIQSAVNGEIQETFGHFIQVQRASVLQLASALCSLDYFYV